MKKLIPAAAVAILLCLLLSVAVSAQYDEDQSTKLNLKLGFFKAISSRTQDVSGRDWSLEELTYDSKSDEAGRPTVQLSVGGMESLSSDHSSMFKVGIDRVFWKAAKGDSSWYYGFGAGLYKMKIFDRFRIFQAKELNAGGSLFVGYNIHDAYTLELRGLVLPPVTLGPGSSAIDVNLSGVMFCASTRRLF
jgi:hypothetical protein